MAPLHVPSAPNPSLQPMRSTDSGVLSGPLEYTCVIRSGTPLV
jgi:hypothetical protein